MDTCHFIVKKVIAAIYIGDIIFWSVNENDINKKAMELCKQGGDLKQEDDTAGLMGVTLGQDEATGLIYMKQIGHIDRFIETLVLDDRMEKRKFTPSESKNLLKDSDGS